MKKHTKIHQFNNHRQLDAVPMARTDELHLQLPSQGAAAIDGITRNYIFILGVAPSFHFQ